MNGRVVLIVDDDFDTRIVFGTILRHHGFEVLEAASGEDGLLLAARQKPDLVLMDLEMPVLNGYETLMRLRAELPSLHDVPVVAVTALAWEKDRERALRAGFAECIVKPCEPMFLLARVRKYFPESRQTSDSGA